MTLIAAFACPYWAIMVSDRLTTAGGKKFDAHANKNVVVIARDGVASLGYTGAAFVSGVATDDWIAKQISSQVAASTDWSVYESYGGRRRPLGICAVLHHLQTALCEAKLDSEIEILAAGVRTRRGRQTPFLATIGSFGGVAPNGVFRMRGRWRPNGKLTFVGAKLTQQEVEAALAAAGDAVGSPEYAEALLSELIVGKSRITSTVGDDLEIIRLSPSERLVSIAYRPGQRFKGEPQLSANKPFLFDGGQREYAPAFSPWIVGEYAHLRPSIQYGSQPIDFAFGNWRVCPEAGSIVPDGGDLASMSMGQDRRPSP